MISNILGVKVNIGMTLNEVVSYLSDSICNRIPRHVCTTNPEFIMSAQHDDIFKRIINSADLSLPDGSGVLYANSFISRVATLDKKSPLFLAKSLAAGLSVAVANKTVLGNKITGVDLFDALCSEASLKGYTVFLLGGRIKDSMGNIVDGAVDLAILCKDTLLKKYPTLKIIGATSKFNSDASDDVATLNYIHECMENAHVDHIDLLFVAYNHPKQDYWIERNRMKVPAMVSMAVGGTFDYVAGVKKRPSKTLIDMNLEWLYRLITQPWRIKRIFIAVPLFTFRVIRSVL
jgi:N-acetylglucosaminyldiphosphoundecaprenol N-acetyl-beta-D-mannosaminyltransferase